MRTRATYLRVLNGAEKSSSGAADPFVSLCTQPHEATLIFSVFSFGSTYSRNETHYLSIFECIQSRMNRELSWELLTWNLVAVLEQLIRSMRKKYGMHYEKRSMSFFQSNFFSSHSPAFSLSSLGRKKNQMREATINFVQMPHETVWQSCKTVIYLQCEVIDLLLACGVTRSHTWAFSHSTAALFLFALALSILWHVFVHSVGLFVHLYLSLSSFTHCHFFFHLFHSQRIFA